MKNIFKNKKILAIIVIIIVILSVGFIVFALMDSDKDINTNENEKKEENVYNEIDKPVEEETEKKEIVVEKYKTVEMSLTVKQADELLGTEVKGYSASPELVQTLLNNQKGIV